MSLAGVFAGECDERGRIAFDLPMAVTAYCRAKFGGRRVDVEIRPRKSKRTERANAALHAGLWAWAQSRGLAGEAARLWVEDIKDDLLGLCWGYAVRANQLTGEITKRLVEPHTAALSVEQFTELFDVAQVEAAKDGYIWSLPRELETP